MSQLNVKFAEFRQKIGEQYQKNPILFQAVVGFLGLLLFALGVMAIIKGLGSMYPETASTERYALPTPTLQYTPQPTPTVIFTPSNEWVVNRFLDPVKQNGFTYAVAEFRNLSDGTLVVAQCQQPKIKQPEVGHLYILQVTKYADWYFMPIEGYGTYQMFLVTNK